MAIKTFTTGEVLTASDTNTYLANAGLVYVTSTTLSGVTNTISNVFSSTYDSYRVVITNFNNATTTTRQLNIRIGTDATANYDFLEGFVYGASLSGFATSFNQTASKLGNISQADGSALTLDIHNPNKANFTVWTYQLMTYQSDVASYVLRQAGGIHKVATAFTGFQIIGTTDNLSGNVIVYGYRKA